jgi:hypothetical protein
MSDRDEIKIRFESSTKYEYGKCNVAYGRLYLNDMYAPALRVCMDMHVIDLPLKVNDGRLLVIEKAPYFFQIPPYQYIVYTTSPDILYLISTQGARRIFCYASTPTCDKLPQIVYGPMYVEHVYNVLINALI